MTDKSRDINSKRPRENIHGVFSLYERRLTHYVITRKVQTL
nr:MAG TPA: hypothetical protein [Caudoviricetes sp.]